MNRLLWILLYHAYEKNESFYFNHIETVTVIAIVRKCQVTFGFEYTFVVYTYCRM